ncbi:MAG: histidine--tRNA ligase, partial [Victivallales bacterium]|nr:histidine--tRNA ligase [Victivallales bacterium]
DEIPEWRFVENAAARVFQLYGYLEMRTPVMEFTELFQRGIGDETDVVKKEMYSFEDKGGRSLTLRPEGTAGIMRSFAGTDVMNGNERRVFYMGPMFRGEKPAAGRKRQFHQIGVENAGGVSPLADAESIAMLAHYLDEIGITGYSLLINTRGSFEDRIPAEALLMEEFSRRSDELCDDCRERLNRNVWRVVDCKNPACSRIVDDLPDITDSFSEESRAYFAKVCEFLSKMGIEYSIDSKLVRGLDYYVHTVFEVTHPGLGAQNSLAGGGRYEVPVPSSKRPVPGVGFALGVERLLMAREALGEERRPKPELDVYLVSLGQAAVAANLALSMNLRKTGISTVLCGEDKSMKAQMRAANRLSAKFALIRGEQELETGIVVCKNMKTSEQTEIPEEKILEFDFGY